MSDEQELQAIMAEIEALLSADGERKVRDIRRDVARMILNARRQGQGGLVQTVTNLRQRIAELEEQNKNLREGKRD